MTARSLREQPAPGLRIEDCVTIDAPADAVWRLLEDVNGWSAWNPLYAHARGSARVGDAIDFAVVLPGMKPQTARATVAVSAPCEMLHYGTVSAGGLLRGMRYVHITPTGPNTCAIANGEMMGGLLGPVMASLLGEKIRQAIAGMNAALKAKAEASA